eukprot:Sspe_Gene.49214::Locus_26278_Transcript_1_1_Confidence_1.000_Length_2692::g.49214::m.49214/K04909/KCNH6; potassium voltage-gated channel Eag-related subfamily H member 6
MDTPPRAALKNQGQAVPPALPRVQTAFDGDDVPEPLSPNDEGEVKRTSAVRIQTPPQSPDVLLPHRESSSCYFRQLEEYSPEESLKKITDAEMRYCKRVFDAYDVDNSGTIDLTELNAVMTGMGVFLNPTQLEELFEQVDTDQSNSITFDEFLRLIMMYREGSQFNFFDGIKPSSRMWIRMILATKCLVPDAPWRWMWNVMIMLVVLYFAGTTSHYCIHTNRPPPFVTFIIDGFLTLVLMVDMLICSRTGYPTLEGIEDSPRLIMQKYIRTWFVPDLLGTIPFEFFVPTASTADRILRCLRLTRVFKLPFLFVQTSQTQVTEAYVLFHYSILPMFNVAFWLCFFIHYAAEVLIYLQEHDGSYEVFSYDLALYVVTMTLSSVGYGDIDMSSTRLLRLYATFLFFATVVVNGMVVGKVMAMASAADVNRERRERMRETLAVMRYFDVPLQLKEEILQFQYHVLQHDLSSSYNELLSALPRSMQDSLALHVKIKYISMVPMFQQASRGCKIALAQALIPSVCTPEQYIVVIGEEATEMFFVGHGFAEVLGASGEHVMTIKKGGFFGEVALLNGTAHVESLKALTYVDLFKLEGTDFFRILSTFPKFKDDIRHFATVQLKKQASRLKLTDEKNPFLQDASPQNKSQTPQMKYLESLKKASLVTEEIKDDRSDNESVGGLSAYHGRQRSSITHSLAPSMANVGRARRGSGPRLARSQSIFDRNYLTSALGKSQDTPEEGGWADDMLRIDNKISRMLNIVEGRMGSIEALLYNLRDSVQSLQQQQSNAPSFNSCPGKKGGLMRAPLSSQLKKEKRESIAQFSFDEPRMAASEDGDEDEDTLHPPVLFTDVVQGKSPKNLRFEGV